MFKGKIVLKWIGGLVFALAFLLLGSAFTLTYFFEDKVKSVVITEVNKHLTAEIKIKGENINLSFLAHFPYASLSFRNFKIKDLSGDGYIAEVKDLYVLFNPLELWQGNYQVYKIILKDADLDLRIDKNGVANYIIWKTTDTTSASKKVELQLKNISLLRVNVHFADDKSQFYIENYINEAFLKGSLYGQQFNMLAEADFYINKLQVERSTYVKNQHVILNSDLNIDNETEKYAINKCEATINNADFEIKGYTQNVSEGVKINYEIIGKESKIQTLLALLPEEYAGHFKDYESKGKIHFNAKLNGLLSAKTNPSINVNLGIKQGIITDKKNNISLQNVNFNGKYSNGSSQNLSTSAAEIKNFTCTLRGKQISGNLSARNFADPYLETNIKGNASLADLKHFLVLPYIDDISGHLQTDISFKGKVKDLEKPATRKNVLVTGSLALQNTSIISKHYDVDVKALEGNFHFNGNDLEIEKFAGLKNSTDFALQGSFKNLAAFFLLPDQKLQTNARFISKNFRMEDFISNQPSKNHDTVYSISFPAFLLCNLAVDINKFSYGKIVASNVTGNAQLNNNVLIMDNIRFNTMSGEVAMQGKITPVANNRFQTDITASCKDIDVSQLFYGLDNLGQAYLTNKHIKGKLTATTHFNALWNSDLSADFKSINAETDISIDNGRLIQFEPLVELGKFAKIKNLHDLSFSKLSNKIYMRNNVMTIPQMDVNSSAVNMKIAGTHTFDNIMDYRVEMNVSQLLFGKKADYEDEFGEIDVDENDGAKLFVKMTGPGDNIKFAYDVKQSRKNFTKGLKQESQELKNIFNDVKPDGTPRENLNKKQEDYELQWEDDRQNGDEELNPKTEKGKSAEQENRTKAWRDFKNKISKEVK